MIEFDNITRTYARHVAVDGLSLAVRPGELFALLGPNGAGKTTTIKVAVGLLRADSGTVRLCGRDVTADPREAVRVLGYVPDEPFLYDKLSGRELLEFVAEMRGMDRGASAARIARESANFELTGFLDRLIETYSHGMKQRLVFASALLHDPEVLIIDEPMVGLDPRSVRMVKDLLRARVASGTTIFMSTHTLAVAEEIADRIGILNNGRLHFLGTMEELRQASPAQHTSLESLFLKLTDGNHDSAAAAPPAQPELPQGPSRD
ncbi:MAG: ABC transporter ATP-binding protein [Pirellulales bacterium]|nr:ABC transporter ATP-binding protein [Pirellulales bacterium]